jgi:hypothetical protein
MRSRTATLLLPLLAILSAHALPIHDVQFSSAPGPDGTWPSDLDGETVTLSGIVTATNYNSGRFFVQDEAAAWSGVLVWDNSIQPDLGDELSITGVVFEYNGHTEIYPVNTCELLDTGQPLPVPVDLTSERVDSEEEWEGVLARLQNVSVTQEQDNYGQWEINDGTTPCEVDDVFFSLGDMGLDPQVGNPFSTITGIVDFQYGNRAINPRTPADIIVYGGDSFLIASDTEVLLGEEATCWLDCGDLSPADEVYGYSIQFQIPEDLVVLSDLITEGSLSNNHFPQLTGSGGGLYELTLEAGSCLQGDLPLVGLSLEGSGLGSGSIDLLAASVGTQPVDYLDDGLLNVISPPEAIGDTLTLIMRPLLNVPAIVVQDGVFEAWADAPPSASAWTAALLQHGLRHELGVDSLVYDGDEEWWHLWLHAPDGGWTGLADFEMSCDAMPADTSWNAVQLLPILPESYYFAHVTDTHLPTHMYYDEPGALQDSASMGDLRAVFDDLALINPAFVLLTGDVLNEGELEEFMHARYYTRAQRLLAECTAPIYVVAGNHDLGGWDDTPPPDGTSRYDWWRFFGWPRLDEPPVGAPARTQDYWVSYGDLHLVGLEAYDNYDGFRYDIYGETSFTSDQMTWVEEALALAEPHQHKVLFYHYDFAHELNLAALDVDMALYGHSHSDNGSLNGPPWELRTDQVTDHGCSFRLIRVTPDGMQPFATQHACSGDPLRLLWSDANNGTMDSLSAMVQNNYSMDFPEAILRARLLPGVTDVLVTGGQLQQLIEAPDYTMAEVIFNSPAGTTVEVSIQAVNTQLDAPMVSAQIMGSYLTLSWDAVPGAGSYRVEARESYQAPWEEVSADGTFDGCSWAKPVLGSETGMYRLRSISSLQ